MFEKIVVVDSTGLNTWGVERLKELGKEVVFYTGIPETDEEIVNRIGDADCVLVSYNTQIRRNVIEACPNIKYIGMCCTLYSESSANVDIAAARERGITVLGIRDYGDEGVVEYVISELVRLLHGFGGKQWRHKAYELGGQKVGIVGLGRTGRMIADALRFLGAISAVPVSRMPRPPVSLTCLCGSCCRRWIFYVLACLVIRFFWGRMSFVCSVIRRY